MLNSLSEAHSRTRKLIGYDGLTKLQNAYVAVIGLGGVGGSAAEALLRSGIGKLDIYDGDNIEITNLNRQVSTTWKSFGENKAVAMQNRLLDILPGSDVIAVEDFVRVGDAERIAKKGYDYIIDAIDTMKDKVAIITAAKRAGVPIISATGAAFRLHASMLEVTDLFETTDDPLCRILRRDLRKNDVNSLKVVYSKEKPMGKTLPPATMAFVPNTMGLLLANQVVLDLLEIK